MKFINKWGDFVNEEWSMNDPIPELHRDKEKLGIILLGVPGSGKSTLASLLLRFYDPDLGKIFIDGKDAKAYSLLV